MNAGAMGSWLFDVVETIRFVDRIGVVHERRASEVNVEYRGCPLFKTHIALGAVLVGHAAQVGANTMLCGQVGLAGSTKIGDNCILAGQVGTAGHLTVGDGTVITAQSGVPNDVPARALYSGYPAVENRQWLKMMAALNRLPELQKRVQTLESELEALRGKDGRK